MKKLLILSLFILGCSHDPVAPGDPPKIANHLSQYPQATHGETFEVGPNHSWPAYRQLYWDGDSYYFLYENIQGHYWYQTWLTVVYMDAGYPYTHLWSPEDSNVDCLYYQ